HALLGPGAADVVLPARVADQLERTARRADGRRDPDRDAAGRHRPCDDGVRAHDRVVPELHGTQHLGAGTDLDSGAQRRPAATRAVAVEAQGYLLTDVAVRARAGRAEPDPPVVGDVEAGPQVRFRPDRDPVHHLVQLAE